MSYSPPAVAPKRSGAGLPAIGVLLMVQLTLELAVLCYDLSKEGPAYLPTALGFSFDHAVEDAPAGFYGGSTAFSVALVALSIAAFTGRRWARPAAVTLLATNGYDCASLFLIQLRSEQGIDTTTSALLLNLSMLVSALITVVVVIIALATRGSTAAPAAPAAPVGPAFPPPPAPNPYTTPAHPFPPQQPGYPTAPPQQPDQRWS